MSADTYGVLTYRGDVRDGEEVQVGQMFGWRDPLFQPWEVMDIEYVTMEDIEESLDYRGKPCMSGCLRTYPHTHVHLQWARPDTMKEQAQTYGLQMRLRGLL